MDILKEFIFKTEKAINLLEIKKKDIEQPLEKIHQYSNIARTVGTSVSTAGAGLFVGALLLAPFTGGISIVAASGLGAACGIGGAIVNIGTEVADHFASKAFTSQIKDIIQERNKSEEKLKENFGNISNKLVKEKKNEYDALTNSILLVFKRGITIANLLRIHNINSIVGACSGIKFAINCGGQFWRSMRVQSLAMRKALASLGFNVTRKAAMAFIRCVTFVLSTVFVYLDVNSLIKCWQSKHPNMTQLEDVLKKYKEDLDFHKTE